jgi:2-oxoglutarate ferredoxin oxidoreductase subunit alpha
VDVLVALNQETVDLHRKELAPGGVCVFDSEKAKGVEGDGSLFGLPMEKLAVEKAGDRIMANTVALGAALAIVGYDLDVMNAVLTQHFGKGKISDNNVVAGKAGYDFTREQYKGKTRKIRPLTAESGRMFLTGNDALSLGAIAAGCKFMAAYPMTPASSIMEYFAAKSKDLDLVMVHAEDEIAAVHMAVGASYAGVRAMTATSGGGFCLMVEGLGLAGITETPLVIVDAQRPGPGIGLPTRVEQGDLQFVLHAHHGDFPRAVLAPATIEDCFWAAVKAFNWADIYQLPVIILTDHHLATSYGDVGPFDLSGVVIDRGSLYSDGDGDPGSYLRHKMTRTGISPRAFPGLGKALVVTYSDEHDEAGHLIEDAATRTSQMDKRLRKLNGLRKELTAPLRHGSRKPDNLLIGWGSTYGALQEAADILRPDMSVGVLHINEVWPFPAGPVSDAIEKADATYVVEGNAGGQLARLIRAETGKDVAGKILRYDGRPLTPAYIAAAAKKESGRNG